MEPRIQYAQTADGVSIAFWTLGDGLPILHMPPIPWSHIQLEWQDPDFRRWYESLARGGRLVRYDSRGSGLSKREATDLSLDAMLMDVEAVADRLGLERFALAGVCFSGPLAIAYAARYPGRVSHLFLWCACARISDMGSPQLEALAGLEMRDWELFTETVAHAMVAGWSAGEQARRFAALMRDSVTPEVFQSVRSAFAAVDVTDLLPRVRCPTLVLHRRQARFPSAEVARGLASTIRDAQLVLLEGGSLLPFVGDMDVVVRAIEDFLGLEVEQVAEPPRPREAGGPVTILFTDVEGSTALTQRLGDAKARQVMREHDRITREALKAHGGSELKTTGDGFMASFSSATRALECAIAMQRAFADWNAGVGAALAPPQGAASSAPTAEPIRVRIGLNAGEPIAEEEDLFGTAVIVAARIAAQAEGGEILASDVVRQLVAGKGFLFADRGETALRGFEDPVRLYEVRWREEG